MRLLHTAALVLALGIGSAQAATELDLFFPVPVQGKLATEMTRLVEQFDATHPDIAVTAVYTGSYDDTNLKTRAAIQAGRPPGAVIMSANFVREYAINNDAIPLDDIIARDGQTPSQYMDQFWPALRLNATDVYLNVAGGLRIAEPAADLAAAAALVSSLIGVSLPHDAVYFGEIALSGAVRAVGHSGLRLKEAAKLGFSRAIAPASRKDAEAARLTTLPVASVAGLVAEIAAAGVAAKTARTG